MIRFNKQIEELKAQKKSSQGAVSDMASCFAKSVQSPRVTKLVNLNSVQSKDGILRVFQMDSEKSIVGDE